MSKYKITTEYKKILPTSNRELWHWEVRDLEGNLIGRRFTTTFTRRGAEKEAKRFIQDLNLDTPDTRKTIDYEV